MEIFLNPVNGIDHPVLVPKKKGVNNEDFVLRSKSFKKEEI